ncbi:MAG: HD domain-containing protein [Candidatus Pacebacteria bacterium]|nr:HD domain-containing protein [Candidatus Paceibacterota bacterium]
MKKEIILKRTKLFTKKALSGEGTGHDWWHIERVLNNANLINKTEKADAFVIELAVLLHDIGDRKVIQREEDDYTIAENFLKKQKVADDVINQVMFIIKNMSFSKSLNHKKDNVCKEFYIVQDADRLDAIGAIGIARAFTYGGSKERPLYDPTKKAQKINSTKNYRKLNSSTFHHFEEKLLLLEELMNTRAAKRIAKKRTTYMQKYLQQFLDEWFGKK